MPDQISVSILMPAFNVAQYIEDAVNSILLQTVNDFELLILDDCSTDKTSTVIETFRDKRIRVFRNAENQGYLKSCNFLFGQARGEFICFQDADDWSYPTRIEKQVRQFHSNPSLGICSTRSRTEVNVDKATIDSISIESGQEIKDYIAATGTLPFTCGTVMIRKSILPEVGLYREFFDRIGAEHVDWAFRIVERHQCFNVNEVLYYYRFNRNSFTKSRNSSVEKKKSLAIAEFLHQQRIERGYDSLEVNENNELESFLESLREPYRSDRSLIFRQNSIDYLNKRQYADSIKEAAQAISIRPNLLANWGILGLVILRIPFAFMRKLKKVVDGASSNRKWSV